MVELSDFMERPEDEEPEEEDEVGETDDLVALKDCLQALADAIASTNLAVINSAQGDQAGATSRVHASVTALKRFHTAFTVLKGDPAPEEA